MGRKTNSVSLRLKKTNKDFHDCWYGDILYSENFTKSLKIKTLLSQTLKSVSVPCAHFSLIGAFKKSNVFVGYLDPEPSRKQRCESFYLKLYPRLPNSQSSLLANQVLAKDLLFLPLFSPSSNKELLGKKKQRVSNSKPYNGQKSFCFAKDKALQLLTPNTVGSFKVKPRKREIPHNAPLGLLSDTLFATCSAKTAKDRNYILQSKEVKVFVPKLYKPLTFFPQKQSSGFPEKFISVLLKTTEIQMLATSAAFSSSTDFTSFDTSLLLAKQNQQASAKPAKQAKKSLTFPVYNIFSAIGFLYFVKAICKHLGKTEALLCTKAENHILSWFSRRQSLFFAMQAVKTISNPKFLEKPSSFLSVAHAVGLGVSAGSAVFASFAPCFAKGAKEASSQQLQEASKAKQKQAAKATAISACFTGFLALSAPFASFAKQVAESAKPASSKQQVVLLSEQQEPAKITKDLLSAPRFLESSVTYSTPKYPYAAKIKPYFQRLENLYGNFWGDFVCISLYKSVNEACSALFLAHSIAYYLERRVQFRRLKRQLLLELSNSKVQSKSTAVTLLTTGFLQSKNNKQLHSKKHSQQSKEPILQKSVGSILHRNVEKVAGIRVCCSGRVGGRSKKAQRSRKETLMWGETGLHVFSSKLDFARTHAETGFGLVGIQVWICYK